MKNSLAKIHPELVEEFIKCCYSLIKTPSTYSAKMI